MKRLQKSIRKEYKMPHLFLEDIEQIESVVKEAKPREYAIEFGGYEYAGIDEVPKNVESTTEFHIRTRDPYLSLDLSKYGATLYISSDDLGSTGLFAKVNETIKKRERKFAWFSSQVAIWLAPALFFSSIPPLEKILKEGASARSLVLASFVVALALWWYISYALGLKSFSKVEFTKKKDRIGFVRRKKDQILLSVISAVVGSVLTVFLERLLL